MLYALIGILIYVAFRFEYRFALGSISALIHDVLITLGFFSVFQFEFDLTVLAAILAVIGYSAVLTMTLTDNFHVPPLGFCITGIHPVEVARKNGGFIPTCPGPDFKEDIAGILGVFR